MSTPQTFSRSVPTFESMNPDYVFPPALTEALHAKRDTAIHIGDAVNNDVVHDADSVASAVHHARLTSGDVVPQKIVDDATGRAHAVKSAYADARLGTKIPTEETIQVAVEQIVNTKFQASLQDFSAQLEAIVTRALTPMEERLNRRITDSLAAVEGRLAAVEGSVEQMKSSINEKFDIADAKRFNHYACLKNVALIQNDLWIALKKWVPGSGRDLAIGLIPRNSVYTPAYGEGANLNTQILQSSLKTPAPIDVSTHEGILKLIEFYNFSFNIIQGDNIHTRRNKITGVLVDSTFFHFDVTAAV
ncbi:hypothetical protein D9613_005741 [Agrocybe pediades]|uniref:Uncharacterized protein n=1 Tax=Agrocybe pediades TaxID=84607 RepID=A0A8H4QW49_9AGAR|nr:hypothetical protein D9613_005741 [Agrocybe pediades]